MLWKKCNQNQTNIHYPSKLSLSKPIKVEFGYNGQCRSREGASGATRPGEWMSAAGSRGPWPSSPGFSYMVQYR